MVSVVFSPIFLTSRGKPCTSSLLIPTLEREPRMTDSLGMRCEFGCSDHRAFLALGSSTITMCCGSLECRRSGKINVPFTDSWLGFASFEQLQKATTSVNRVWSYSRDDLFLEQVTLLLSCRDTLFWIPELCVWRRLLLCGT
jgi:hypothetical protein